MSDPVYKKLYSSKRMVADLVRVVAPEEASKIDFSTLEDLSAEYVGERNQRRIGDAVWRARLRGCPLHVLILLEFQSTKDSAMAQRMLEYAALLLGTLRRKRKLARVGSWPLPLPVVLYTGAMRWTAAADVRDLLPSPNRVRWPYVPSLRSVVLDARRASEDDMPPGNLTRAVVGFEKSATPEDLARVATALLSWLDDENDAQLRRDFGAWAGELAEEMAPGGSRLRPIRTLEDASMTLVERVREWPKPWIEQGLANQRALLRRLATTRFGAGAGARLSRTLAGVSEQERLEEVGDCIVTCATADEFLQRIGRLGESAAS